MFRATILRLIIYDINFYTAISTTDLSATEEIDYDKKENTVVLFDINENSTTVDIDIASDTYIEHDEHFLVTLHDPVIGAVGDVYKTMVIIKDKNTPGK